MYVWLGVCIALASLLFLNSLTTAAAACLWRALRLVLHRVPAATPSRAAFLLRVFPALLSLAVIATLLLAAYVAHELGHVSARDNFKRALMRVCRDALLSNPCGHALDRQWAEASESAADEY